MKLGSITTAADHNHNFPSVSSRYFFHSNRLPKTIDIDNDDDKDKSKTSKSKSNSYYDDDYYYSYNNCNNNNNKNDNDDNENSSLLKFLWLYLIIVEGKFVGCFGLQSAPSCLDKLSRDPAESCGPQPYLTFTPAIQYPWQAPVNCLSVDRQNLMIPPSYPVVC